MSLIDFDIVSRLGKLQILILIFLKGEGAYSSVYQVKRKMDGSIYALKKVKMGKLSDKEKENALNEVRILASIKH
jgi:NIMA (never in mitosis gene a)-related kinase